MAGGLQNSDKWFRRTDHTAHASVFKNVFGLTGFKVIVDTLGRDVKPSEPDLDPEVAAAAFKMWGWTPETGKENGKKNGDKK